MHHAFVVQNTETHVLPGDGLGLLSALAKKTSKEPNGFLFAHCKLTGALKKTCLGRLWMSFSRVIYAYSEFSGEINPSGWSSYLNSGNARTVFFGEYKNKGPGSMIASGASFFKKLTDIQAKQIISLKYVEASCWLIPPQKI